MSDSALFSPISNIPISGSVRYRWSRTSRLSAHLCWRCPFEEHGFIFSNELMTFISRLQKQIHVSVNSSSFPSWPAIMLYISFPSISYTMISRPFTLPSVHILFQVFNFSSSSTVYNVQLHALSVPLLSHGIFVPTISFLHKRLLRVRRVIINNTGHT
jgi:hypothetical protein